MHDHLVCAPHADNDITHNNLDLIRSLKEEVAEMKKKEISNEKLMFEIAQENKKVSARPSPPQVLKEHDTSTCVSVLYMETHPVCTAIRAAHTCA